MHSDIKFHTIPHNVLRHQCQHNVQVYINSPTMHSDINVYKRLQISIHAQLFPDTKLHIIYQNVSWYQCILKSMYTQHILLLNHTYIQISLRTQSIQLSMQVAHHVFTIHIHIQCIQTSM